MAAFPCQTQQALAGGAVCSRGGYKGSEDDIVVAFNCSSSSFIGVGGAAFGNPGQK
jgi:hypothetical protein